MNRWATGALGGIAVLAALAAWEGTGWREALGPRPTTERPLLALLTSLPLIFGESFGLEGGGSAVLTRLEQRYAVMPIGVVDAASLEGQRLLLMAHPRAQPAEALVELDEWVRRGGKLLLLADPKLDWPSERPMGDRLRPPPAFADTGLLAHWGISLRGPTTDGPAKAGNGKIDVTASSPGKLAAGSCRLAGDAFVARCRIGNGAVTVIADADFLNVDGVAGDTARNLDLLIDELHRLESR